MGAFHERRIMNTADTAALKQHGVTPDVLAHLEAAGYDTLADLARVRYAQLAAVPGLTGDDARSVVRAVGALIDIGYSTREAHA